MTDSPFAYRIKITSTTGAVDWFPVWYRDGRAAAVDANVLGANVSSVSKAELYRVPEPDADPEFVFAYVKGSRA